MTIPALQMAMVNGKFIDRLSVQDRGLAYGDGLFETMRMQRRRVPLLRYHLDRLALGCSRLRLNISPVDIRHSVELFIEALPQDVDLAIVKLVVTRGAGGQGYKPPGAEHQVPTMVLQSLPLNYSAVFSREGVTLEPCRSRLYDNPLLAGIKHLNRLDYVLAAQELPDDPHIQGLLLNVAGNVVEAIHHNIFLVKNTVLFTPRVSRVGVAGVMRRAIIEKLSSLVVSVVKEEDLPMNELGAADEVFICNSVRGIWPVRRCGDLTWMVPGPITSALQQAAENLFENGL